MDLTIRRRFRRTVMNWHSSLRAAAEPTTSGSWISKPDRRAILRECGLCKRLRTKWTAFLGPPGRRMADGLLFPPTGEQTSKDTNFPRLDSNTLKRQVFMWFNP